MRVTYFHYVYNSSGPLVQINEFASAFRKLGHELKIHAMDEKPQASQGQQIKEGLKRYVASYLHEVNTLTKNVFYYQREHRIVEAERPDVVLSRYKLYRGSAAFVARRLHLPYVIWIDAPASYEQRKYLKKFVQIPGLAEGFERMLINMADRAVLVSEEIKKYLPKSALADGRVKVIPNGVDTGKFNPSLDARDIRRQFPESSVIIGFVGSFSPWHGIEALKSLMDIALTSSDKTCFLLVGEGSRRAEVEEFIRSKGWDSRRIRFTGHVSHEEVPRYVAAMDICLLPYDQESDEFYFSPLKLFEYMSCAKPVLASRLGQIEKVIQDGINGFLYAKTQAEMADKLKRLIQDASLRKRLGENARQTILDHYTWHHTALAFEKIFESLIQKGKEPR